MARCRNYTTACLVTSKRDKSPRHGSCVSKSPRHAQPKLEGRACPAHGPLALGALIFNFNASKFVEDAMGGAWDLRVESTEPIDSSSINEKMGLAEKVETSDSTFSNVA